MKVKLIILILGLTVIIQACRKEPISFKFLNTHDSEITSSYLLKNGFTAVKVDVNMYSKSVGDTTFLYTFCDDEGTKLGDQSWIIEANVETKEDYEEILKGLGLSIMTEPDLNGRTMLYYWDHNLMFHSQVSESRNFIQIFYSYKYIR